MSKSKRDKIATDAAAKTKNRPGLLRSHKIEIPETRYKSDLELHDRFLAFSETLLRLALAGFAAVGFFIATLTDKGDLKAPLKTLNFIVPSSLAVVLLALSAALALGHRFLASDGMYHHLRHQASHRDRGRRITAIRA